MSCLRILGGKKKYMYSILVLIIQTNISNSLWKVYSSLLKNSNKRESMI